MELRHNGHLNILSVHSLLACTRRVMINDFLPSYLSPQTISHLDNRSSGKQIGFMSGAYQLHL